jgi:DNA-binding IclR family transcriptional regulator
LIEGAGVMKDGEDSDDAAGETDRRFATTLARGLSVLRAFRPGDGPLGNLDLSERTGLPRSTISRLTFTLSQLGYLEHLKRQERYRLGPAALALGNVAKASFPFLKTADLIMQDLANDLGALVALAVRDRQAMMLTHCWRPQGVASIWLDVGFRLPVERTAPGHALLATWSDEAVERFAATIDTPKFDGSQLGDTIRGARDKMTAQGFVSSIGGWVGTINAAAVPFWPDDLAEPFVFLCGALSKDMSEARVEGEVGPRLREMVAALEKSAGFPAAMARRR